MKNESLEKFLESIEAKTWVLVLAEMEALLAEEILAVERVLTTLAESSRDGAGGAADHRAQRLEAVVARIEGELATIERMFAAGAGKSLRPAKPTGAAADDGRLTATAVRKGRGRPRKPTAEPAANSFIADISTTNDEEEKLS